MNILAIDTSTSYCSIAVKASDRIITQTKYIPRQHNQYLLDMVNTTIIEAGITKHKLDLLAYGIGPGSFVGVRLSAALMQAISFVITKPVLGFSSMYAIAMAIYQKLTSPLITVILDARVGEAYLGQYRFDGKTLRLITITEQCISIETLSRFLNTNECGVIAGTPPKNLNISVDIADYYPDSQYMFTEIQRQYQGLKTQGKEIQNAMPVYLQGTKQWKKTIPKVR